MFDIETVNDAISPSDPNDNVVEIASDLQDTDQNVTDNSVALKELSTSGDMYYTDQADMQALLSTIEDIGISKSLLHYLNGNKQLTNFLNIELPATEALNSVNSYDTKKVLINALDSKLRYLKDTNHVLFNKLHQQSVLTLNYMNEWKTKLNKIVKLLKKKLSYCDSNKIVKVTIPVQLLDEYYTDTCIGRLKDNLEMIYNYTELNGIKPDLHVENTAMDYSNIDTFNIDKDTAKHLLQSLEKLQMLNYGAAKTLEYVVDNTNIMNQLSADSTLIQNKFYKLCVPINAVADINIFCTHTGRAIVRTLIKYVK